MLQTILLGASVVGVTSFIIGCIIGYKEQQQQKKQAATSHMRREPNPYSESLYFTQHGGK